MQDVLNFIAHETRLESFIGIRHERANAPVNKKPSDNLISDNVKGDLNTDVKGDLNELNTAVESDDIRQAADLLAKLDKMSYKELKAYAGIKGNIKREKIYELIHLSK
jgi:hypothetical protein